MSEKKEEKIFRIKEGTPVILVIDEGGKQSELAIRGVKSLRATPEEQPESRTFGFILPRDTEKHESQDN